MRTLDLAASLLVAITVTGCNSKGSAPTPPPPETKPAPTVPVEPQAVLRAPAVIIFTGAQGEVHTVGAVMEDGSKPAATLSASGVDSAYIGSLPGRRAALAEHAPDGSVVGIASVSVDGKDRAVLGTFPAVQYGTVQKLQTAGTVFVAELSRMGTDTSDIFVLKAGTPARMLAPLSHLVTVAGGRVAMITEGNLRSMKLDGTGTVSLGGNDGHDHVADVRDDRLFLTMHADASADARVIRIDGTDSHDVGQPKVEEQALSLTDGARLVYLRRTATGGVLVSAGPDGKDEQELTDPKLDAKLVHVAGQQLFASSVAGALLTVTASGGPARVLDPAAGDEVRVGAIHDGRVIYTSHAPAGSVLRAAKIDGSGLATLCNEPLWLPFFSGVQNDRVVFYRALAGQLEGGAMYSVKLDGTDRRAIGTSVTGADGAPMGSVPADQDFEAITPSGRLILESEFSSNGGGSQLLVGAADSDGARLLSAATHVRYAGMIE